MLRYIVHVLLMMFKFPPTASKTILYQLYVVHSICILPMGSMMSE